MTFHDTSEGLFENGGEAGAPRAPGGNGNARNRDPPLGYANPAVAQMAWTGTEGG